MNPHSTLYPMDVIYPTDVILTYRNNHKISWMVSVIQQISRGCTSVHMCEILQTKWKYFKISHGSEKCVIVLLLHNEINYFQMICQIFVIYTLNTTFNTIKIFVIFFSYLFFSIVKNWYNPQIILTQIHCILFFRM